jgi:hypothetical protein|tara:strand:- start:144 stop:263 length:120 start_codon:yes stop_codon:yes gene_type:complete
MLNNQSLGQQRGYVLALRRGNSPVSELLAIAEILRFGCV